MGQRHTYVSRPFVFSDSRVEEIFKQCHSLGLDAGHQVATEVAQRADETVDLLRRALRRRIDPDWDGCPEALDQGLVS